MRKFKEYSAFVPSWSVNSGNSNCGGVICLVDGTTLPSTFAPSGSGIQGGRTLNSCNANDLREVVDIPTGHSAAHGDTFFILALLEQANGEAF